MQLKDRTKVITRSRELVQQEPSSRGSDAFVYFAERLALVLMLAEAVILAPVVEQ
jgi:hypothetical protein